MVEKFFKCTLLTDVVLNSKLATEGNMETLDYIPGSNFLGIVAAQLYPKDEELKSSSDKAKEAYNIFHSGKVSFGDATISEKGELSYPVPFDYMMVKGEDKLGEEGQQIYLQHTLAGLKKDKLPKDKKLSEGNDDKYRAQLKQKRTGFITPAGKVIPGVAKNFALKSAQDATTRRSAEGKMFGFESLQKEQEFIFSVRFEDNKYLEKVTQALTGRKRIGKSKTAQYGQVNIEPLTSHPQQVDSFDVGYTLVYAQSNLCFFDVYGQPTLQPTAKDLGIENGEINWKKSSVRTYEYSPWNGKRNTTDSLRTCIAAGSVFYIEGKHKAECKSVGAFQAEGLGRVVVNPSFLEGDQTNAKCKFSLNLKEDYDNKSIESKIIEPKSDLGNFLFQRYRQKQDAIKLSKAIQEQFEQVKSGVFFKVSSSQWGAIRAYATKAKNIRNLKNDLMDGPDAYLKHGVAYERIWSKRRNLDSLETVFTVAEQSSSPTIFIAKFASEMAKYEQKKEKNKG